MRNLTIIKNPLAPRSEWIEQQTDDIFATLQTHFESFPETARLYCGQVAKECDVTPQSAEDIEALKAMEGDFFVVVYPGYEYIIYAIIIIIAVVAITMRPKIPNSALRNNQATSPNNALSNRSNQERVNSRIPDIYGTVNSIPDLLAVPYSIFNNHIEFEHCYMCIGRGYYAIEADTVRDGQTVSSKIEGESVAIYAPETSPNTGDAPQLLIGDAIDRLVINAVRSKSVNGQTLMAPNEATSSKIYSNLVTFVAPNKIVAISGNPVTFLGDYNIGDSIIVTTPDVSGGFNNAGDALSGGVYYSIPRNVKFHADGSLEFEPGFLASLYTPYAIPGTGDGGGDTYAGGFGAGIYLQINKATINISGTDYDFSGKYLVSSESGDFLYLTTPELVNASWNELSGTSGTIVVEFANTSSLFVNFSGTYEISSVADKLLELVNPDNYLNAGSWLWASTGLSYNGGDSSYGSDGAVVTIGIGASGDGWVGPFVLDVATMNQVFANYIATNGMYADDGESQTAVNVTIQMGVTPCTAAGVATGAESFFTVTVEGSDSVQSTRAATLFADLPTIGRYMVRSRRLTPKNLSFSGTVVDEVKWRDVYASSPVGAIAFGNVTTVQTVTQATQSALAVQDRQINMMVTRMLPAFDYASNTFSDTLYPTNDAADILSAICRDPKIGNRPDSEVNFRNFYDVIDNVKSYFGIDVAAEFSYTFDSDNLSFEEMLFSISQAVFCTPHRRGRVIELLFEQRTDDSVLLFNHRNKVPKSETRTTNFGASDNKDGIEFEYISPVDNAAVTFYVPEDRTAVNPKKFDSIGIRSVEQAHLHAYREYNKLLYQTRAVTFDATQESEIISTGSRILVADNTRPDTQDGYIEAQNALELTLSQPCITAAGSDYVICLQLVSGLVEILPFAPTADPYKIILTGPPSESLVTEDSAVAKTVYIIVKADDVGKGNNKAFLLTEKAPKTSFVNTLTCVNYDNRYYQNDQDFI